MNEEELKIVITAQADKLKSALQNATKDVDNFEKQTTRSTNALTQGFQKLGAVIGKVFAIGVILKFGKACVDTATQTQNAWIGLNSILTGKTGTTEAFKNAQSFINDYVKDGLVPLNNAVASYKNLALRGYNSDQIEKTMIALKNSSTFARQSTYSLGEAVQTATEGLKNENSVVVDNAGVTKNVAKMWEDYAKSIGKTTSALTQQEKIEAEVNGILEETKFQSNDAKIYSDTYSGSIARLSTAFTNMKNAIGEVVQPIVKMVTPALEKLLNLITGLFKGITGLFSLFGFTSDLDKVTSSVTGTGESVDNLNSGLEETAKDSKKAKQGLASFDEINNLQQQSGGAGGMSGGAGLEATNVEVSKTSNIMEDLAKAIPNIDLKPLLDSLKKLKAPLKDFADICKNSLQWSWENVLKPLGKWSIEDLAPSSVNLLASSVDLLNETLLMFRDVFGASEEELNVFGKIAQWTGKNIITTIDGISMMMNFLSNSMKLFRKDSGYTWNDFQTFVEEANVKLTNFQKVWSPIQYLGKKTADILVEAFVKIKDFCVSAFTEIGSTLQNFSNNLIIVADYISNTFAQAWSKSWENIKTQFSSIWGGIVDITKNSINLIIDKVNRMIAGLETALNVIVDMINSIKITNPFNGEDIWSPHLNRMSFSRIPKLARGGIVDGATTFIAGEHGKEAVIPLENNTEWLDNMASRVVTMLQAVNELGTNSVTINVPVEIAGKDFAKATIKDLNLEAIRQGYKPILN